MSDGRERDWTCEEALAAMMDGLGAQGSGSDARELRFASHLATCVDCAKVLSEQRATRVALKQVDWPAMTEGVEERLHSIADSEVPSVVVNPAAGRPVDEPNRQRINRQRSSRRPGLLELGLALAAVAGIVLLFARSLDRASPSAAPGQEAATEVPSFSMATAVPAPGRIGEPGVMDAGKSDSPPRGEKRGPVIEVDAIVQGDPAPGFVAVGVDFEPKMVQIEQGAAWPPGITDTLHLGALDINGATESRRFALPISPSIPLMEGMPSTIVATVRVLSEDLLLLEEGAWLIAVGVTDRDGVPMAGTQVSVLESSLYATVPSESMTEEQVEPWLTGVTNEQGIAAIELSWTRMADLLTKIEQREPPLLPGGQFHGVVFVYSFTHDGMRNTMQDIAIPIGDGRPNGVPAWLPDNPPEAWTATPEERVTLIEVVLAAANSAAPALAP